MMRGDWCIVSNMAGIDELKIGLLWAEMAGTEWQEGNRLTVSWLIGLEFTRGEEIYCGIIPEKLMSGELVYCADVWHRFSKEQLLYYPPHPPINGDGWVYIGITLSICSSVCVSDRVHSVSPEPLNHFFIPNLVWWCIMRLFVMQKNWFTIFSTMQWGAADTEIKVPSGENTEFKHSPFKAWSRSVYGHTCYAYCQGFLPCLFLPFRSIHLHFFQNLSWIFLRWLCLTHGSCVGLKNKQGHPAGCTFQCWVPTEYK